MSAGKKLGGYNKIFYGTTAGLSTSTQITGLWSGTLPGDSEMLQQQDSAGRTVNTGVRQTLSIFSTAVTAAFVTNLIAAQAACTELYFRLYYIGGGYITFGPHIVKGIGHAGAEPGQVHRLAIETEGFTEDILDQITYN